MSGSLNALSTLTNLNCLDASDNTFSGTIPDSLYNLTRLNTIVLSKNCFEGEISPLICNLNALTDLIFNGLASSPK